MTLRGGTLSNIENILQQQKYFTVDARTQLYDKSLLQARFKFDMTSPVYAHTVKGSLLPMTLTPLNHMLEKSEPMSIDAGTLNKFEFELSLNSTRSEGLFYMGYDNLNVVVLEYKSNKRKKSGFASFWANKMVLNTQNPKGNTLEPVSISYDRDIQRSIINYWWKSIYSGAKEVLGIKPKE
jgi:hypothetical protein